MVWIAACNTHSTIPTGWSHAHCSHESAQRAAAPGEAGGAATQLELLGMRGTFDAEGKFRYGECVHCGRALPSRDPLSCPCRATARLILSPPPTRHGPTPRRTTAGPGAGRRTPVPSQHTSTTGTGARRGGQGADRRVAVPPIPASVGTAPSPAGSPSVPPLIVLPGELVGTGAATGASHGARRRTGRAGAEPGPIPLVVGADGKPLAVPPSRTSTARPTAPDVPNVEDVFPGIGATIAGPAGGATRQEGPAKASRRRKTGQTAGTRKRRSATSSAQTPRSVAARGATQTDRAQGPPVLLTPPPFVISEFAPGVSQSASTPVPTPVVPSLVAGSAAPPTSSRVERVAPATPRVWPAPVAPVAHVPAPFVSSGFPAHRYRGAAQAFLVAFGLFFGTLLVVSALEHAPRAHPKVARQVELKPTPPAWEQPEAIATPAARGRNARQGTPARRHKTTRTPTPESGSSTSWGSTWAPPAERRQEAMPRVEAQVDVTGRVFEPQPPQPRRTPIYPQVVRRLLANYQGRRVVVTVAVDALGGARVDGVEATIPLSEFVRARFEDAALQAGWRPATDELGKPVAGTRRVAFVLE